MTPEFTLADRVLQRSAKEKDSTKFRMDFKSARRFHLSEDFMRRVFNSSPGTIDDVLARCDLARLPFERVWLEISETEQLRAAQAAGNQKIVSPPSSIFGKIGYYIRRNAPDDPSAWRVSIYVSTDDFENGEAMCLPIRLYLTDTYKSWKMLENNIIQRTVLEAATAQTWGLINDEGSFIIARELLDRGMMTIDAEYVEGVSKKEGVTRDNFTADTFKRVYDRYIAPIVDTCTGDLRFLVCVLAILNHVPTRTVHVPRTGTYRKRLKNIPYLDYQCIEIDTSRVRTERSIGRLLRRAEHNIQHRRAHEVRGHWRYYLQAPRCSEVDHIWEEKDADHHTCMRCGTRRTWIDAHQRGDASIGYVTHDYEVVK